MTIDLEKENKILKKRLLMIEDKFVYGSKRDMASAKHKKEYQARIEKDPDFPNRDPILAAFCYGADWYRKQTADNMSMYSGLVSAAKEFPPELDGDSHVE